MAAKGREVCEFCSLPSPSLDSSETIVWYDSATATALPFIELTFSGCIDWNPSTSKYRKLVVLYL